MPEPSAPASDPKGTGGETPEQTVERLQAENDALRAGQPVPDSAEAGTALAAETPIAALKESIDSHPGEDFVAHLKRLAAAGFGVVLDPAVEADVSRVIVALVGDLIKGVKL